MGWQQNSLRRLLKWAYQSPPGRWLSLPVRWIALLQRPFMVYGFTDPATGVFRKYVRMSSAASLLERERLAIEDHVWVGHHALLDATGGLDIGEGCQIGAWVGVFSHGSHHAIRLLGHRYVDIPHELRPGYVRSTVKLGPYTFIGSGSIILPGVRIGRGCIIGPNCVVSADIPDYAIVAATPARVVGSTMDADAEAFRSADFGETYFDPALVARLREAAAKQRSGS